MRWPFSKKHHDLTLPPVDEQPWSIARGEVDGDPVVVRFNEFARKLAGHPDLFVKLSFAVPLNLRGERGLPDAAENEALGVVEDVIAQRVLASSLGLHAMTLTTGSMREFIFYIAPGSNLAELHEALRMEVRSHDLQCMAVKEPKWQSFRALVP